MSFTDQGMVGVNPAEVPSDANKSVEQYFRQQYPYEAWILDIPELRTAVLPVIARGGGEGELQAALEGTQWWKTRGNDAKNWDQTAAENPGEAARQVDQQTATIQQIANSMGVTIPADKARQLGTDAARYGWTSNELMQTVKGMVGSQPDTAQKIVGGTIDGSAGLIRQAALDQMLHVDEGTVQSYARQVANGMMTMEGVKAIFGQQAARDHPDFAGQITAGATLSQLFNAHRNAIAQVLELDPGQVDFMNNPVWSKVTSWVPPGEKQARSMTISEAQTYARQQPGFKATAGASAAVADFTVNLNKMFGKMG